MKYIVCLGDGMADEPVESLGNKTPLEKAHTPNMDAIAKAGICGLVKTVPGPFSPGSDVANMGILGYDPQDYYTGRGPIEAAAMNIVPPAGKVIFRCNLVTIENNTMIDFTAGHISDAEGKALMEELHSKMAPTMQFFPGVSYRHIVLLDEKYLPLKTSAPHDYTDKSITTAWPQGETAPELMELIEKCRAILADSPINKARIKNGKRPATDIWPWSQGRLPQLPSFKSKFGHTGGIITAVDLLRGLGTLTQLEAPIVEGATGFIDTNYENKVAAALDILKRHDFVYLHVEAPDECGHMGNAKLKTEAIEAFDEKVVGPILQYQKENPATRVLVLPDHPTPCHLKTHTPAPVPYAMCGPNVSADETTFYTEVEGEKGRFFGTPWDLMGEFLA